MCVPCGPVASEMVAYNTNLITIGLELAGLELEGANTSRHKLELAMLRLEMEKIDSDLACSVAQVEKIAAQRVANKTTSVAHAVSRATKTLQQKILE